MKVAIVGTGISGLVVADGLAAAGHDLTVYEAGGWIGGHTNTVEVEDAGRPLAVDTGFIVFNERTYPNFIALMRRLGVTWKPSDMSFSVRCDTPAGHSRLEYNGSSLGQLFAQRSNALRPSFLRMVRDILRFYREAPEVLADEGDPTLGAFLEQGGYSRAFIDQHLVPMAAAVWSARPDRLLSFPMRFLVKFFENHGFLQLKDRPQWLVIRGGSREYVGPLTAPFADRIRLDTPVASVVRKDGGVVVTTVAGDAERFDRVVLACHSDQALRLLADADALEREVVGAFAYQRNEALLHVDASVMPVRRRAWASWNYHVGDPAPELPTVTYWMNNLQGLDAARDYFVTLNRTEAIDPAKVLRSFVYHHPIFSPEAVRAQARHGEIDGRNGVHFCGAYWGWGFHEDGVKSALAVLANLVPERELEPVG